MQPFFFLTLYSAFSSTIKCVNASGCKWCPIGLLQREITEQLNLTCYENCKYKYNETSKDLYKRHRVWFCKQYNKNTCSICNEPIEGIRPIDHYIQCRSTELSASVSENEASAEFVMPLYSSGSLHYSIRIKGLIVYMKVVYSAYKIEFRLISDSEEKGWKFLAASVKGTFHTNNSRKVVERICDEISDIWDWGNKFDNDNLNLYECLYCNVTVKFAMKNNKFI